MRIEGELLKLGISVSATTIATVLRRSGLGPAPRRIGPSWSEFLRAQAHSMLTGGVSDAVGDDGVDRDASEPIGPVEDRPACQAEAGDDLAAAAAEPRSPSHPNRCGAARRGRAVSTRLEDRCACSHRTERTLATDPDEQAGARPTALSSRRRSKLSPRKSRIGPSTHPAPLEGLRAIPTRGANKRINDPHELANEAPCAILRGRATA
jgi:hypothetical protein